ncbi:MAG: FIST N-terminal domain-containing protein [Kangiellaceae bacterium]|jgi:hypothetical protein|nr:FIST N-terminal domain-containing protein [Kangiellaceae bacterium]
MKVFQYIYKDGAWSPELPVNSGSQWVTMFGDRTLAQDFTNNNALKGAFPNADIIGCSTSGEIAGAQVMDNSLILTAATFEATKIACFSVDVDDYDDSYTAGSALSNNLESDQLKYALIISNGTKVNGTKLVDGVRSQLADDVVVTGGLAGDDDRFEESMVWLNNHHSPNLVVICGLYGDALTVGHGSVGGWDQFGPARLITHSEDNVLYKLDDRNALELYKEYLGDHANGLPASALKFPLAISDNENSEYLVRTILSIDEEKQSMTFAGDLPEGQYARLMRANFDRLIDGASEASEQALTDLKEIQPQLALLISCVGRRLVLGQRVEEELEEVAELTGDGCINTGFYSYGEISPLNDSFDCKLHNQTMTITLFSEVVDA